MLETNLYRILQVDPKANPEVIAAAFRVLSRALHPERDSTGIDELRLAELKRAHAVLSDPEQRRAYDLEIAPESLVAMGPGPNGHALDRLSLADRVRAQTAREAAPSRRLDFGRYQGWTLAEVGRYDPDYLRWLSRHSSGVRYRNAILQLLMAYDKQPVAASRSSRSSR